MTSLNVITIRLLPKEPVPPAAFKSYLQKLSVKAWDLSVADTVTGTYLGEAKTLASDDISEDLDIVTDAGSLPRLQTAIIQHWETVTTSNPPLPPTTEIFMKSVATAVIVVDIKPPPTDPPLEYPTPTSYDLRIELAYDSTLITENDHFDFKVN